MGKEEGRRSSDPTVRVELLMALRAIGIGDSRILSAIEVVDREKFVEGPVGRHAGEDVALPISCGQTTSAPSVIATSLVALRLDPRHKVLEIGTGSGYQTVILARLVGRVFSIERYRTLLEGAKRRFSGLNIDNIFAIHGDGMLGWPSHAPFDRIVVSAAGKEPPQALLDQLVDGGRMVMPIGEEGMIQQLMLFTRKDTKITEHSLTPVRFVPLVPGKARAL